MSSADGDEAPDGDEAQVPPSTTAATRLGSAHATERPIGPPQS